MALTRPVRVFNRLHQSYLCHAGALLVCILTFDPYDRRAVGSSANRRISSSWRMARGCSSPSNQWCSTPQCMDFATSGSLAELNVLLPADALLITVMDLSPIRQCMLICKPGSSNTSVFAYLQVKILFRNQVNIPLYDYGVPGKLSEHVGNSKTVMLTFRYVVNSSLLLRLEVEANGSGRGHVPCQQQMWRL